MLKKEYQVADPDKGQEQQSTVLLSYTPAWTESLVPATHARSPSHYQALEQLRSALVLGTLFLVIFYMACIHPCSRWWHDGIRW